MHHACGVARDSRTRLIKLARSAALARHPTPGNLIRAAIPGPPRYVNRVPGSTVSYSPDRVIFHPRPGSEKNSGKDECGREKKISEREKDNETRQFRAREGIFVSVGLRRF